MRAGDARSAKRSRHRAAVASLYGLLLGLLGLRSPAAAQGAAYAPNAAEAPAPNAADVNSTVVTRGPAAKPGQGVLSLTAALSENGQDIVQGLSWYVFGVAPGADGKRALITSSHAASAQFNLAPGDYFVNANFGRATLTRKLTVVAGQPLADKFNLNAGGLRVKAVLPGGEPAPDKTVVFDVLNEERDQSGNRVKVVSAARPGLILRLNAGVYQVVTTYGDANARVRAEVTVEPGKLTEATLTQTGAKLTFKLVSRPGGEALADVVWSIINIKAETVKQTAGAVPTHILAAGRYAVEAKHLGRTYRVEFTAKPGDSAIVEVVAQ